jgi:hypothetical protein
VLAEGIGPLSRSPGPLHDGPNAGARPMPRRRIEPGQELGGLDLGLGDDNTARDGAGLGTLAHVDRGVPKGRESTVPALSGTWDSKRGYPASAARRDATGRASSGRGSPRSSQPQARPRASADRRRTPGWRRARRSTRVSRPPPERWRLVQAPGRSPTGCPPGPRRTGGPRARATRPPAAPGKRGRVPTGDAGGVLPPRALPPRAAPWPAGG